MNEFWSFLGARKVGAMRQGEDCKTRLEEAPGRIPGLAGWLLRKLRRESAPGPRLVLKERITLAPRQTLALIEAEGRRFLVATSPEGAPAFYALDERGRGRIMSRATATSSARMSW